jgi:hypothetical protein
MCYAKGNDDDPRGPIMTTTITRTNRYAADCAKGCGTRVPAEAGNLVRVNGRWGAEHVECPAPVVPAPVAPVAADCGGCEHCDGEGGCAPSAAADCEVTEAGMYRKGAQIFKVQRARGPEGRLYAKRLVQIGGERVIDADERIVAFEFAYAPGALRGLTANMRMSVDEAVAFGIRYGVCCVCGKGLKAADSVLAGIGPVCGKRI